MRESNAFIKCSRPSHLDIPPSEALPLGMQGALVACIGGARMLQEGMPADAQDRKGWPWWRVSCA